MQSLDRIKRRIKSIQTTSKITGAMKLVATAKMKKTLNRFKVVADFCKDFYKTMEDLVRTLPKQTVSAKQAKMPKLWVVVTSSLGLCGGFNINVCKHLISQINPNDKIVVIGKKGYSFLKTHGLKEQIIQKIFINESELDYLQTLPLCESILSNYQNELFSCINLVYTKFVNSLTFIPTTLQLLPFDNSLFKPVYDPNQKAPDMHTNLSDDKKEIIYEPSKTKVLEKCMPIFITTSIFTAISESLVCENGARRNAMETATDNAEELTEELLLQYNEVRQHNITQEINEIVAGANGGA